MRTDHDILHDLLERTAPARPEIDPGTRAAAVARRHRNTRRRGRGLVAAAVVLTAIVAVPLTLGGTEGSSDVATPPPTPFAPPCPVEPIDVGAPEPAPALVDVVAVRSCPATVAGSPTRAPSEASLPTAPLLGDAAAAFADMVTTLPAYTMPMECAAMSTMAEPWALVLTTADGDSIVLGSTMRVCSAVRVDGIDRGVDAVIGEFTATS